MSKNFDELVSVMRRLRAPGGCPWDREQTYASLAPYLIEEANEVFDAIQTADETGSTDHLREELGDLLLQVVFHATIGNERGDFTIDDVAAAITEKLILRHPHVFAGEKLETAADVLDSWDELKAKQRAASGKAKLPASSILDEIPVRFPALLEAVKLSSKAAKIGFDWESDEQLFDKLNEERDEFRAAASAASPADIENEIGDLLFVIVNMARRHGVDPETALKKTNRKFRRRFSFIEKEIGSGGGSLADSTLGEMDALWNRAKLNELKAE